MALPTTRLLSVQVASGDALDVRSFEVYEEMSALYQVTLVARCANPDIDLDSVVGFPASFNAIGGAVAPKSRAWTGVCMSLHQTQVDEHGLSTYEIRIGPALWLLTHRKRNRIFQLQSELEIVEKVLGEWGIQYEKKITSDYKKRKYRVQYAETDFAFLCRMMEDVGISFYFDPESEAKLVLSDAPQMGPERAPLAFRDQPNDGDKEYVTSIRVTRQVRPGKYTIRDQDYRRPPAYRLMSSAKGGTSAEEGLELYNYVPGSFLFSSDKGGATPVADDKGKYRADEGEGGKVADKRLAAKRATAKVISFDTNALDLGPGSVLSILDHPKAEVGVGKKLLVTQMTFSGTFGSEWSQSVQALSADIPFFPMLSTPKPKVAGIETATVVGPPGEQIHVDEFGRVRVQFHWDLEGGMDDGSSCWIPVCHPWAGGGFGHVNLPRVGHEVIVDFLSGDPDRPVVVGRVYTNLQKVPYALPALKTQSGWKSQTVGGTGYNEIMFEDAPGRELVRMQAEKDLTKLVKHDESVTIGNDRTKQVGNNDSLTVGNNRTHTVGNNETIMVGNNQTITIGVNQTLTVGANQTITLPAGNQTESITGNRTFTLTGDLTETITGNSTLTQTGNQTETVTGNWSRTETGSQTEILIGDHTLIHLGNDTELQAGNKTLLQLGDQTVLELGSRKDIQLGSRLDVQIGGTTRLEIGTLSETVVGSRTESTTADATQNVGATLTVNAGTYALNSGPATFKTGPFTVTAGPISMSGGTVDLTGSGAVTVTGSIIKLNC